MALSLRASRKLAPLLGMLAGLESAARNPDQVVHGHHGFQGAIRELNPQPRFQLVEELHQVVAIDPEVVAHASSRGYLAQVEAQDVRDQAFGGFPHGVAVERLRHGDVGSSPLVVA